MEGGFAGGGGEDLGGGALELVIRKCISAAAQSHRGPLKHHGLSIRILAYADDIVLLARNPQGLQHL